MLIRAIILWMALVVTSIAHAQVNCGPQPDVPADVKQKLKGDVEGKAQIFTKLLGDANLKGTVETSRSEVYQKYKDLDKSQIDRYMIWISCQNIMSSQLTATEKAKLWIEIYRELAKPSDKQGSSSTPLSILAALPLHTSTIAYAESLLGTPRTETPGRKAFERNGYTIEVRYLTAATSKLPKDAVTGLRIYRSKFAVGPPTDVDFTGEWNRPVCGPSGCRPMILPTARLGKTTLGEFNLTDCDEYELAPGGDLDPPIPVCLLYISYVLSLAQPDYATIKLFVASDNVNSGQLVDLYLFARQKYSPPIKAKSSLTQTDAAASAKDYGLDIENWSGFPAIKTRVQQELSDKPVYIFDIQLTPDVVPSPHFCTAAACGSATSQVDAPEDVPK
jgi:hypothetical protein